MTSEPGGRTVETSERAEDRDRDLVARVRGSDEEAFRHLFEVYAPSATSLAMRVVRQANLAEEIVQEAFISLWRSPEGYDATRGSVRAWLMGMVHHRAVDAVRREEAQRRRADGAVASAREETADHADDVVREIALPEEQRVVRAALGELPTEQREVLELMYFDGLTQTQVAEKTGLPLGTVKSRTLLGMRRMRSALEGLER